MEEEQPEPRKVPEEDEVPEPTKPAPVLELPIGAKTMRNMIGREIT